MKELDSGTADLLARVEDGVAVLTMNRPDRRNALSPDMIFALGRMLALVADDDEVGAVLLTGAGGAFCAGGDVKAMAERDIPYVADGLLTPEFDAGVRRQQTYQRETSGRLWTMPKPVVAALPGPAAGAGLALALACDLRYAVEGAVLTTAFARVGFSGDFGGSWFLTRLVGTGKARELYYLSDRITAPEAERLGILNGVLPAEGFEAAVLATTRRLAAGPRLAYRYMKENLDRAVHGELFECLDAEALYQIRTGITADHRNAARAFVEKREPTFGPYSGASTKS